MAFFKKKKESERSQPAESRTAPGEIVIRLPRETETVRQTRSDYQLSNSELIFSAATRLANSIASMPLILTKNGIPVTAPDDHAEIRYIFGHRPNNNMTASDLFRTLELCRDTTGNSYLLKLYDRFMQISQVLILNPDKVQAVQERTTRDIWYRVNDASISQGGTVYIHADYIIHFTFASTNGINGINPVNVLSRTLDYSEKVQDYTLEQFDRGVNAKICIESPSGLSQTQIDTMVGRLQSVFKMSGGSILFLDAGAKADTLKLSPIETETFDIEKISRGRVAMVYNIPPHMMGDYSDVSYTSMEQSTLEYVTYTILPIVNHYEGRLNTGTLNKADLLAGYAWRFDTSAYLRADAATRADVNNKAIRGGWDTPNGVRLCEGKTPYANGTGDEPLVARDLLPLKFITDHPEWLLNPKSINTEGKE